MRGTVVSPGGGAKGEWGHAAIYVSTPSYSGGISNGGDVGFKNGARGFIAGYNAEGRTVTEYKMNISPAMEGNLAMFIQQNPGGDIDPTALGADLMITQNCTTAVSNALVASGAVAPGLTPPGSGLLYTPSNLAADLSEGGVYAGIVAETVVYEAPVASPATQEAPNETSHPDQPVCP
jgi:hypothetical protein